MNAQLKADRTTKNIKEINELAGLDRYLVREKRTLFIEVNGN